MRVLIQHTSMQFSDSVDQHIHDAKSLFARAEKRGVWACTGTEAGGASHLGLALARAAREHDFYLYVSVPGEWVALNKKKMIGFDHGFAGPYIKADGRPASQGGHNARGIAWCRGMSRDESVKGQLTFGAVHYLTQRSENATGVSNRPLTRGLGVWGNKHGEGRDKVFIGGDVNTDDRAHDVFMGKPFTTIADELGKWPATHDGHVIDIIASYDHDRTVKGKTYQVLDDRELYLASDHHALEAGYEV